MLMDAYNETLHRLQEMESRYHDGFSSLDRSYLDTLYYDLFGKEISNKGCSDGYRDAYMEIKLNLRKTHAMPKNCDYKLKAGAVITFFGESVPYTNPNLTNEVAERYIAKNVANASMFQELPEDWKDRVNAYIARTKDPNNRPAATTLPDALAIIAERDKELAEARETIAVKDTEVEHLKGTISSLETALENAPSPSDNIEAQDTVEAIRLELASANETIEADKAEIERLNNQVAEMTSEMENLKKENKGLKQSNAMLKKSKDAAAE